MFVGLSATEPGGEPVEFTLAHWRRRARAVPGDPAKAARGFENKIMVSCLAHHMALAFLSAMELVRPRREFKRPSATWR